MPISVTKENTPPTKTQLARGNFSREMRRFCNKLRKGLLYMLFRPCVYFFLPVCSEEMNIFPFFIQFLFLSLLVEGGTCGTWY